MKNLLKKTEVAGRTPAMGQCGPLAVNGAIAVTLQAANLIRKGVLGSVGSADDTSMGSDAADRVPGDRSADLHGCGATRCKVAKAPAARLGRWPVGERLQNVPEVVDPCYPERYNYIARQRGQRAPSPRRCRTAMSSTRRSGTITSSRARTELTRRRPGAAGLPGPPPAVPGPDDLPGNGPGRRPMTRLPGRVQGRVRTSWTTSGAAGDPEVPGGPNGRPADANSRSSSTTRPTARRRSGQRSVLQHHNSSTGMLSRRRRRRRPRAAPGRRHAGGGRRRRRRRRPGGPAGGGGGGGVGASGPASSTPR